MPGSALRLSRCAVFVDLGLFGAVFGPGHVIGGADGLAARPARRGRRGQHAYLFWAASAAGKAVSQAVPGAEIGAWGMFFFHLRTRAGFFSKGVGPLWNATADSRMDESSESESDDIVQDNAIPETGEEEDGRDLDDIVQALVDAVRGQDDIDMCDLVTDHLRYASLRSRMGLEMRARTFCPPVVRRNVRIVAAGDLDPIDQEDVVSLLTRVEWACETIKGFAESSGKKHKKRGEFAAIGPLSSLLIEAFSKYLLDRTVAQVRYHTLGDFIEGCIEALNFPNDYEDVRRALGRLLEKMGIRTVRQLCEHPTVDTEKKRAEMAKLLSNKGRFKAQCK